MSGDAATVLVVEDDAAVGMVLTALLTQAGIDAHHVLSGKEALSALEARPFDTVISDLRMPEMDGLTLLGHVSERWPGIPFVLITAHGSVATAVEAMKAGAADFLTKPVDKDDLLFVIRKALASAPRTDHVAPANVKAESASGASATILASSPSMNQVLAHVKKAAAGTATVLVRGETGTGKELVARAVHELSARKNGPFVKVHCAALPDALLESELFGYEKGAFTGAGTRKPGRVELAEHGTLFLDEIGDITPAVQVKLLRVLQEREYERLGGTQTLKADVRFVAATHRDLEAAVAKGEFREDLFYRLNVVPIVVPPLRQRPTDIEALAQHFARAFGGANGRPRAVFDRDALAALGAYAWPGNVRQLQNLVERLVVLSDGDVLGARDVQAQLGAPKATAAPLAHQSPEPLGPSRGEGDTVDAIITNDTLDANRRDAEKQAILRTLGRANNNRSLAARLLNVSRRTLYNKLREHGIE